MRHLYRPLGSLIHCIVATARTEIAIVGIRCCRSVSDDGGSRREAVAIVRSTDEVPGIVLVSSVAILPSFFLS